MKNRFFLSIAAFMMTIGIMAQSFKIENKGDKTTIVKVSKSTKYILLPVQESAEESKVCLLTGSKDDTDMDVRLAKDYVDYYVPFQLQEGKSSTLRINGASADAICWKGLELSDKFNTMNREKFRPLYHHTPAYGWMNDANGLFYKDGVYHLYFQYNPYGSKWGNMHWGHSTSTDLMHWKHEKPAIARDNMGHIFSGSSVVDKDNTAGYGKGTIVSFYTSASDKNGQIQCMAHSSDNGYTFKKYEKNPILTSELKDFRDPKCFWYAPQNKWILVVSADKEMRFYESKNLKDWKFMSAWGKGYGVQPNQFECPDFFELPVPGTDKTKWVLIVNINPGSPFGGSATEYFTGEFDGNKFTCETEPEVTKYLDWGKDHYAIVCFSNTGSRVIAVPWMSNWQYCQMVPTKQYRSANALPRELSLYEQDGLYYVAAAPVKEVEKLRGTKKIVADMTLNNESHAVTPIIEKNKGAYEINMTIHPQTAWKAGFQLSNSYGEKVDIYIDMISKRVVMDRSESGETEFGRFAAPHEIENHDARKSEAINYKNDFALATWAPLHPEKEYKVQVFVDRSSIELFVNGGHVAMTNTVFPTEPYGKMNIYSNGSKCSVSDITIYELKGE